MGEIPRMDEPNQGWNIRMDDIWTNPTEDGSMDDIWTNPTEDGSMDDTWMPAKDG